MSLPSETEYEVGQDNIEIFGLDIHNPVFFVSGGTIVLFVFIAAIFQGPTTEFLGWLRPAVTDSFDWFLVTSGNIFVIFCVALIFTPLGSIRLGGEDARLDFSYTGWFTMLFATGMGIGLMFYGVSELKAAALTTGAPFALVLLGMCVAIWKDLSSERASLQNA